VYSLAESKNRQIPHDAFYRDGYSLKNLVYLVMLGVILTIAAIPHWLDLSNLSNGAKVVIHQNLQCIFLAVFAFYVLPSITTKTTALNFPHLVEIKTETTK
jgi:hypothetical protein